MHFIHALADCEGVWRGSGSNQQGQPFSGRLEITPLVGRRAIQFHYLATSRDGNRIHEEVSLLGVAGNGQLCLWPVMSETETVLHHLSADQEFCSDSLNRHTFRYGLPTDRQVFRHAITIELPDAGTLLYSHAWGLPGGEFAEQSMCRFYHRD